MSSGVGLTLDYRASKVLRLPSLKRLNYVATCADGGALAAPEVSPSEPHPS